MILFKLKFIKISLIEIFQSSISYLVFPKVKYWNCFDICSISVDNTWECWNSVHSREFVYLINLGNAIFSAIVTYILFIITVVNFIYLYRIHGLDNLSILFPWSNSVFFVSSATMATAPYNYSYIFKYIIIGKFV